MLCLNQASPFMSSKQRPLSLWPWSPGTLSQHSWLSGESRNKTWQEGAPGVTATVTREGVGSQPCLCGPLGSDSFLLSPPQHSPSSSPPAF